MRNSRLYVDMDGVLVDFTAGMCNHFHIPFDINNYPFPIGLWDYSTHLKDNYNLDWDDVVKLCNDSNFWANLPELPMFSRLYSDLIKVANRYNMDLVLLTTPTGDRANCNIGKQIWLNRHSMHSPLQVLKDGETKGSYALPGDVLVDDKGSNVQDFIKAGGKGVLIPRPWNNRVYDFDNYLTANILAVVDTMEAIER